MQIETVVPEEQFAVYNLQFAVFNHLQRVNRPWRFEFHQLPKHPWRNYFQQPSRREGEVATGIVNGHTYLDPPGGPGEVAFGLQLLTGN